MRPTVRKQEAEGPPDRSEIFFRKGIILLAIIEFFIIVVFISKVWEAKQLSGVLQKSAIVKESNHVP